jgi:hypothetical protein
LRTQLRTVGNGVGDAFANAGDGGSVVAHGLEGG